MNLQHRSITRFLVASSIALALPFAALARPPMGGHDGCPGPIGMHGEHGVFGGAGLPPFLRGLNLSETQRDKIFEIQHAQAPALRDKEKEVHKAHNEMLRLSLSPQYDEAKARALAESSAKAMTEMALARARSASTIYQLLTPEQRKQVEEQKARLESCGPGEGARPDPRRGY